MEGTVLTPEGFEKMQVELKKLKTGERPKVLEAIREARAHGDLSENAEYHAAKERQKGLEAKISELEIKLSTARIVDLRNIKSDEILMGAKVKVRDLDDDVEEVFLLTTSDESEPSIGKISTSSPIGKGLLNKKKGDKIKIETPGGTVRYQVLSIIYQ